jgi:hypothetical protein
MNKRYPLKPRKLHGIIGTSTIWTDGLWHESLTYLLGNAGTLDALVMVEVLPLYRPSDTRYKIDYLREFRAYSPTLLLGAFDLMRYLKPSFDDRSGLFWPSSAETRT